MLTRIFLCLSLLISVLAFTCAPACAQTTAPQTQTNAPDIGAAEFDKAADAHADEYLRFIERKADVRDARELAELFQTLNFSANRETVKHNQLADTLQRNYRPGTALLFYFYSEPNLQIWLLDAAGIRAYVSKALPLAELAQAHKDLRSALGVDKGQADRMPRRRNISDDLPLSTTRPALAPAITRMTDMLLPEAVTKQLAAVTDLIIVPVLDLGTVPFALLRPFKSDEALVERMSLYLAPSLFEIAPDAPAWSPDFHQVLIVGNPAFTDKSPLGAISPLKGSEQEATAIARQFSTKPLLGRAATKREVVARAQTADLLYFATHGVADPKDSRQRSFLVLSEDKDDLGLWTMAEILQHRYRARLAVLSACQTGLGETYKGGVMALGRTFQVAGVPRVVMSLWSIDDKATAEIMQSFTTYFRSELPAAALRHAMRDAIRQKRDPALWAPFVFFGTPERLPPHT